MAFKRFIKIQKRRLLDKVYDLRFGGYQTAILPRVLTEIAANKVLSTLLLSDEPFFAGRLGYIECHMCWNFARAPFRSTSHNKKWARQARNNAGISSAGDETLDRFSTICISALPYADLVGVWEAKGMYPLLHKFGTPALRFCGLEALDPWPAYVQGQIPWTRALEDKRVLAVHPFARSIQMQYARRAAVKRIGEVMPPFELQTLVPPVTFAGQDNGKSWVANLESLMADVASRSFDVALIGCGAYGLPLGAFIKQMGRQAIHLGGATQLLFGIRGNRWDDHPYQALMDNTWARPLQDERPAAAASVESACYW